MISKECKREKLRCKCEKAGGVMDDKQRGRGWRTKRRNVGEGAKGKAHTTAKAQRW